MMESRQHNLARIMRWAARAIGLVAAGFFLIILIGEAISEVINNGSEPLEVAGVLLGLFECLALAGVIVSWWRERLAGILLAIASAGLGIHIGVYAGHSHLLAWVMVGLPYLVVSILLFSSWRLSR